jgi:serine/threonine-protein kinase HipA
MMKAEMEICLGNSGVLVGTLQYEAAASRGYSCFRYAQSWLESADAFALAPALALNDNRVFFSGERPFPSALMDTLPDSWGKKVLMGHARHTGADQTFNPYFFLLAVPDICRSGALRIRHAGGEFRATGSSEMLPRVLNLREFCGIVRAIETNTQESEALRQFLFAGSSLGGARPKCSVLDEENNLAVAKFTSHNDTKAVEKAEVVTLRLARLCGISAPEARLIDGPPGLPIALIKRFDRAGGTRIPCISAQTMLDSPTADNRAYTDVADEIRAHGSVPHADLKELFKRILFTILVSNVDDHLKNHAFLYAGNNKWRLSPVFDVNPSPERGKRLKTRIADDADDSASIALLLERAFYFEVEEDEAAKIAATMAGVVKAHWMKLSRELGMSDAEIQEYRPAFEHAETAVAEKLGGLKIVVAADREEDDGRSSGVTVQP